MHQILRRLSLSVLLGAAGAGLCRAAYSPPSSVEELVDALESKPEQTPAILAKLRTIGTSESRAALDRYFSPDNPRPIYTRKEREIVGRLKGKLERRGRRLIVRRNGLLMMTFDDEETPEAGPEFGLRYRIADYNPKCDVATIVHARDGAEAKGYVLVHLAAGRALDEIARQPVWSPGSKRFAYSIPLDSAGQDSSAYVWRVDPNGFSREYQSARAFGRDVLWKSEERVRFQVFEDSRFHALDCSLRTGRWDCTKAP